MTIEIDLRNIKRYEPLKLQISQSEMTYLQKKGLTDPHDIPTRDAREAFENEKRDFYVNYLSRKKNAVAQLGLLCPEVERPQKEKIVGQQMDSQGMGNVSRSSVSEEKETKRKPRIKPRSVLMEYYDHGFQGLASEYQIATRDRKKARELLRLAMAAWTKTVERKMYKQLNLSISEKLLDAIDGAYKKFRHTKEGKGKSRNAMLTELLDSKYSADERD